MRNAILLSALFALAATPAMGAVRTADGSGLVLERGPAAVRSGSEVRHPLRVQRRDLQRAVSTGRPLLLPARDASPLPARDGRYRVRADGIAIVTARVDTVHGPQTAVLALGDGVAFGWLPQRDGPALRIETRDGRIWLVEGGTPFTSRVDDFLRMPVPTEAQRAQRRQQELTKAATEAGPNIDVLVLYTPTLVDVWGSHAAMKARVAYLEAITNQAYVDSDVSQTVTVVGAYLVDYITPGTNHTALSDMTPADGTSTLSQAAHRLRAVHGADLVALVREFDRANNTTCGVGWLGGSEGSPFGPEWGFSVSADHGFGEDHCGDWTFAHELGHNMGAHHDFETAEGEHGAYPYSRGFRRTLGPDSGFATIMAYVQVPQVRLGRFSNPRQAACLGEPCGDAATADNARGLTESAAIVAGFLAPPAAGGPGLSIDDLTVVEGHGGTTTARFTLSLSAPAGGPVTVDLETSNGTAYMADFIATAGTVTIPAGQQNATFDVRVRGDTLVERDEYFAVDIVAATGARIVDAQGVVTIDNDDAIPTFTLADAEVVEGDSGTSALTFTASLSMPSTQPVVFDVDISEYGIDGAVAPGDYTARAWDDLTIAPGATSVQFSVDVVGDTTPESDERIRLVASNLAGAEIGRDWARGWIRDDDGGGSLPSLVLRGGAIVEGDAGTATFDLRATLSSPAAAAVTFRVQPAAGSATSGVDFDPPSPATATIPAGATSVALPVVVHGDTQPEGDEAFAFALADVVGATASADPVTSTILDDDGAEPVLAARDDRYEGVSQRVEGLPLDVTANDVWSDVRAAWGSLTVAGTSAGGTAVPVLEFPASPESWVIQYTPADGFLGEESITYRFCEAAPSNRCNGAVAVVVVGPPPLELVATDDGGSTSEAPATFQRPGYPARFEGAYEATPLVASDSATIAHAFDATPESPWDASRTGTATTVRALPAPPGGETRWRVYVDARGSGGAKADLYVGADTDGGQDADRSEILCTDAMESGVASCEIGLTHPGTGVTRYWVLTHNRGDSAGTIARHVFDVPLIPGDGTLTVTGPGRPLVGGSEPIRIAWRDPTLLPDASAGPSSGKRVGYVGMRLEPAGELVWQRARVRKSAAEWAALPLRDGEPRTFVLPPGDVHDRMFVDVPVGASQLTVTTASAGNVDLYLARDATPSSPQIDPAPAPGAADAAAATPSGNETIVRSGSALPPGRWYVMVRNDDTVDAAVQVAVDIAGAAVPPRPGSYFDAARSGHGVFLYPAADQWAGLWYTYFEDGTPTWYYLQGPAPGADGLWTGGLYRTRWDGDSQAPMRIGTATATPAGPDAFVFTWEMEGDGGSEPMAALGRGCPMLGGQAVDASSHWFNPATSGTGHSVQFWSDYEFYAAFVYDDAGVPRFLTAEYSGFAGADATMPIDQLTGFCPLCARTGMPARQGVGTLRRVLAGGTLQTLGITAAFAGGVPGTWNRLEPVQPLGGAGTTQGCAP